MTNRRRDSCSITWWLLHQDQLLGFPRTFKFARRRLRFKIHHQRFQHWIAIFFFAAYLFVADIALTYLIKGIEWAGGKVFG